MGPAHGAYLAPQPRIPMLLPSALLHRDEIAYKLSKGLTLPRYPRNGIHAGPSAISQ